jgi:uncharacterized membrane protein YedE/YeeE
MNFTSSPLLALLIGIAFGACLETAGLGRATKLAGQFTGADLTVLKVLFTAIVTALLGTFWLGRAGVLALGALYVPDTFIVPQLVGGLVFGAGFALAGLCPGTSCVAAASGKIDGLAVAAGMLVGVFGMGAAMPALAPLYLASARGSFTLPAALGLPYGVVVAVVVALAVGVFAAVERWEQGS